MKADFKVPSVMKQHKYNSNVVSSYRQLMAKRKTVSSPTIKTVVPSVINHSIFNAFNKGVNKVYR